MSAPKVLIIGSGVTGALCASGVRNLLPHASIIVMEKARGPGGRMTTTRNNSGNKADLGAQYITTSKLKIEEFNNEYTPLLSDCVLVPLSAKIDGMKSFPADTYHFVAPGGMGSVVKDILTKSKSTLLCGSHVCYISVDNGKFNVKTQNGLTENCDVIISTMPVPQFLALPGSETILSTRNPIDEKLKTVKYSTRFVLVLFYKKGCKLPKLEWASKYIDDEVFCYVTLDSLKRNQDEESLSVVFHTSVHFGSKNIERSKNELESELITRARQLFPDWPAPESTKCHKWLYSQVLTPYHQKPGCVIVSSKPTLILAGDAFSESNFNGCITSARAVVNALRSEL